MGRRAVLEGEDEFVAGAIKAAHPAVVLHPHDQVLELRVDRATGLEDLRKVPPIHADEVDRAVAGVCREALEDAGQEPVNAAADISPEAMANSRWRVRPLPATCPLIGTL